MRGVTCPRCNERTLIRDALGYWCPCGFTVSSPYHGYELTDDDMDKLAEFRMTWFHTFESRKGRSFKARLRISDEGALSFDNRTYCKCPYCGQELILNMGGLFCDNKACGLKIYRKRMGRKISDDDLFDLLFRGRTKIMRFVNKSGGTFLAALTMNEKNNIVTEFSNDNDWRDLDG